MQTIKCCCYWGITGEPWEVRQKSSHSSRVVKYSQVCVSKKKKERRRQKRWAVSHCWLYSSQWQQQKCPSHLSFCNMLKKKLACGSFNSSFLQKTFQWSGVVVERLLFIWFFSWRKKKNGEGERLLKIVERLWLQARPTRTWRAWSPWQLFFGAIRWVKKERRGGGQPENGHKANSDASQAWPQILDVMDMSDRVGDTQVCLWMFRGGIHHYYYNTVRGQIT